MHLADKVLRAQKELSQLSKRYFLVTSQAYYSNTSPINPILNPPATSPDLRGYLFGLLPWCARRRMRPAEKTAPTNLAFTTFQKVLSCHIARLLFNHQPNQPDPKYPRNFSRFAGVFIWTSNQQHPPPAYALAFKTFPEGTFLSHRSPIIQSPAQSTRS